MEGNSLDFYLRDYEQYYEGKDATLAVQEALRECRRHPGLYIKAWRRRASFLWEVCL